MFSLLSQSHGESYPHRLKDKIIRIRCGLALYQTHASPHYFARILDPGSHQYKVRSTKETSRVEARKAAEELGLPHIAIRRVKSEPARL